MKRTENYDKLLFHEIQHFTQKALWITLIGITTLLVGATIYNWKANFNDNWVFVGSIALMILILVAFKFIRLETKIYTDKIEAQFIPMHTKPKVFYFKDIKTMEVVKYNAILDYGGWGIRYGMRNKGKAYNVAGNIGLKLTELNGNNLLIGTQKESELKAALKKINK